MYARATVVIAEPEKVDDVIALMRDRVLPEVLDQPGSLGLSMNVDRTSGRCTVTSVWKDRGSMHASEPVLEPLREQAGRVAGGVPATEEYELAVLHRLKQAEPGCWVRTTRVRTDPSGVVEGIRNFKHQTIPAIEQLPGFRSALLLVNRRTGSGVVSVVFDDRAALDASRQAAQAVRGDASTATSSSVTDVVESEIVVAGLKLPLSHATDQGASPVS
jgi:quinol monooxygenase YgiN